MKFMSVDIAKDEDIYLEVEDNGLGMPEEEAAELLMEKNGLHKHGSGVGLVNVHSRSQTCVWRKVWPDYS
ncbi:MAG: hypothetical protein ACLUGJ_01305 [Blautia wexlerae]